MRLNLYLLREIQVLETQSILARKLTTGELHQKVSIKLSDKEMWCGGVDSVCVMVKNIFIRGVKVFDQAGYSQVPNLHLFSLD